MLDIKKHEFEQGEYMKFLGYVKATWRGLLDNGDWKEEVSIKKVIVSVENNNFDVFVYLNGNPEYYTFDDGKFVEAVYDGKAIKTEYYLNSIDILYMLLKGTLIEDLGLVDVDIIVYDFVEGIDVNEDLTNLLRLEEESYAETLYCIEHDL